MLLGIMAALAAVLAVAACAGFGGFGTLVWLWLLPVSFAGSFVLLVAAVFVFVWIACAVVDQQKPQGRDSVFYRKLTGLCVELLITGLRVRVETRGLEKTPQEGRFLLVCNHLNDSDPGILLHFFRKCQLAFISKRENKDMFLVGKLMHKISCQLVNRENDREALHTILKCIQLIEDDEVSVAVFPEGYESLDCRLLPFRSGVFKIAQRTQVPIVVCTLQGSEHVIKNVKRLKPSYVQLHLLDVISPEDYAGKSTVEIARTVREVMLNDLGEKYRPLEQNT